MKILITGASGFLGRRAKTHFEQLGWDVLSPSHGQLELCSRDAVLRWMEENRPDAVIHCAAVSDTAACQRDPEGSARVNVDAPGYLAEGCRNVGAKLVLCSSDQVYFGSPLPGPHSEAEDVAPGNVYGCQKLLAEQRCAQIAPDTVSLRLTWMYSTEQLPNEHGHFLTLFLNALNDPNAALQWPIYDHRGITDAAQVVQNLPAALQLPGGVYNFGAENASNTYHTLRTVLEQLQLTDALARLTPNTTSFADAPRDIRINTAKLTAAGIRFDDTAQGLRKALALSL